MSDTSEAPELPLQTDQRNDPLGMLVQRIVGEVHPVQIILFGSAARQTAGPHSDLDLLVVMRNGTHRRHTAQRLYRKLSGIPTPFDLVVATEGDLKTHRDNPGLIYSIALKEGRIVYAA
ncbi:MAG: nucleotidyltransferase domain-containing protein [Pirellulales bacterium]